MGVFSSPHSLHTYGRTLAVRLGSEPLLTAPNQFDLKERHMAEGKEKTLEMRVAELEDKLSKVHITEEDEGVSKVSAILGGGGGGVSPRAGCILDCVGGCINECAIRACTISRLHYSGLLHHPRLYV